MNAAVADVSPARVGMDIRITEKMFQQAVVDYARYRGWATYHTYNSRRSEPGFPDLVLLKGERLLFAELKTMRGRVSPAQELWAVRLKSAAAPVYLWRPNMWPQIEQVLG